MKNSGDRSDQPCAAVAGGGAPLAPAGPHLCLFLPFPPSVNGLYSGKARRFKAQAYKAWELEAGYMLNKQPLKHFSTPVHEIISLGRPDKRERDCENYIKAVNDLLQAHGVLYSDSLIEKLTVQWDAEVVGARVEIATTGE